jgi:hypothetical protein
LYGCETIALQAVPGFSLERPNEGVTSGASDPVGLPAHGLNLVQPFFVLVIRSRRMRQVFIEIRTTVQ